MKDIRIMIFLVLLGSLMLVSGCKGPSISEAKFKSDYINYNEMAVIDFKVYNPSEISFDGAVDIRAPVGSDLGFFDCFESANKSIDTVLPKKSYNGELEINSKNNDKCKSQDFDVYFTLKDKKSNEVLDQNKLLLKIKS